MVPEAAAAAMGVCSLRGGWVWFVDFEGHVWLICPQVV